MVIRDIGIGAGTKGVPACKTFCGDDRVGNQKPEDVWVSETNVDDCSGEQLGFSAEESFRLGVKECGVSSGLYEEKQTGISAAGALPGGDGGGGGRTQDFPGDLRASASAGTRREENVLERRMEDATTNTGNPDENHITGAIMYTHIS